MIIYVPLRLYHIWDVAKFRRNACETDNIQNLLNSDEIVALIANSDFRTVGVNTGVVG